MDLWATAATLELASKERTTPLLVLNRMPPRGKLPEVIEAKLRADDLPIAEARIGNRTAFAASMMDGRGVVETNRRSRAAEEIEALTDEVMQRLA
jgi:chromosome partitioning protein